MRLRGDGGPRFAVLDYKTNWLGELSEPLTAFHYRPEALTAEMSRHHYALQALLYTVALHRFLRWRLPGYDPDRHLAGVAYLFVRGMTGDDGLGGTARRAGRVQLAPAVRASPPRSATRWTTGEPCMTAVREDLDPFDPRLVRAALGPAA